MVFARDLLVGCNGEAQVLGRDFQLAFGKLELDVVRSLVSADSYASDGVQKLDSVDLQDVRIILRDYVAIFRVAAYDKAANHGGAVELEDCAALVESDVYALHVLSEDGLEDDGRFLVQDE